MKKHLIKVEERRSQSDVAFKENSFWAFLKHNNALISYLPFAINLNDDADALLGHSNVWMAREIAMSLASLNYQVYSIKWNDFSYIPNKNFSLLFDIHSNLARLSKFLPNSKKILHCTGSDHNYQNSAEIRRIDEMLSRRKGIYTPKRVIKNPEQAYASQDVADACIILGNTHTLETYSSKVRNKSYLINAVGSYLGNNVKSTNYVPLKKEFLWFFGYGAVHKGLDLVLEVFSKHTELVLNVVGNVEVEKDFCEIYRKELFETENIKYHGYLLPSSRQFSEILSDCFCFLAPTCSESMSVAVLTMLNAGLYPILSRDTGVDMPENKGIFLEDCSIPEIEEKVLAIYERKPEDITNEIGVIQRFSNENYSKNNFSQKMFRILEQILK